MRMPRIEILLNFVRNPRKISPFGEKSFLSKTQAYLASWQPKNLTQRLKTVFFWPKFGIQRVKARCILFRPF